MDIVIYTTTIIMHNDMLYVDIVDEDIGLTRQSD